MPHLRSTRTSLDLPAGAAAATVVAAGAGTVAILAVTASTFGTIGEVWTFVAQEGEEYVADEEVYGEGV